MTSVLWGKREVKGKASAASARGGMTAREQAAPRGVRDSCEGKALEEQQAKAKPRDGCGTKQGRSARVCQETLETLETLETAERLRKPGSGTEAG